MAALIASVLGGLHKRVSRYPACVQAAIKLRNQMDGIVAARMSDGIDMADNGEAWLIDQVAPEARVVIDVGANVGAWTQAFWGRMKDPQRAVLFEPSPSALRCLRDRFAEAMADGRVEIVPRAVSDRSGLVTFYAEAKAGETSSLVAGHSSSSATAIEVESTTIDTEVAARGLSFIDCLKIDAEGHDLHVLRGADACLAAQRIGVIQFEYNAPWATTGGTLSCALEYLHAHKYSVYLLKRDGFYEFDYRKYGEFFSYSNFVAVAPGRLPVKPRQL